MDAHYYKTMAENMETQLVSLYEEKSKFGEPQNLLVSIKSLEEQLITLYSEKESQPANSEELKQSVLNLEECVVALIDEKVDLEKRIFEINTKVEFAKKKAKALGSAIFEATLFTENDFQKAEAA